MMNKKINQRIKQITSLVLAAALLCGSVNTAFATETADPETDAAIEGTTDDSDAGVVTTSDESADTAVDTAGSTTADTTAGSTTADTADTTDQVVITENDKPYLALGADLTEAQRNTVLGYMGIDPAALGNYDVVYINNQEEHSYLDSYMDSSAIGTKSLSSVVITKADAGSGMRL